MPRETHFQFTGEQLAEVLACLVSEQYDAGAPIQLAATKRTHVAEFFASASAEALLQPEGPTHAGL